MTKPKMKVSSASSKNQQQVEGAVTIGNEVTRLRFEKALGRPVAMGETLELGILAYHHPNWFKRMWGTLKIKKHPLND